MKSRLLASAAPQLAAHSLSETLHPFQIRWQNTQSLEVRRANLLRRSILRDLAFELHRLQSYLLATGKKNAPLLQYEQAIERYRSLELHTVPRLEDLLLPSSPAAFLRLSAETENQLLRTLEQAGGESLIQRLKRPDRIWEWKLSLEARQLDWTLQSQELDIEIQSLSQFDPLWTEKNWPHQILLLTEARGPSSQIEASHWPARIYYWQSRATDRP